MVKLIATDLDGTFLGSDRKVPAVNLEAARACLEAGVILCLASGRGISTMLPVANQMGVSGPIVSSNGAYITGLQGEDVHHFALPAQARQIIVDYARHNQIHLNCYARQEISFSQSGPFADLYVSRTGCNPRILDYGQIAKIEPTKLLFVDHPENINRFHQEITPLLEPHGVSIVVSEPDYVEFLPPGINKGEGLKALCHHLQIEREEVAAIGDWWNDLEMVEWAGISGAVANAAPEIKAVARHHVASNDEGGAAQFITGILQGNLAGIVTA